MADNREFPSRGGKGLTGSTPAGGRTTDPANDPLAELARLIGQTDPFGEAARKRAPAGRSQASSPPHGYDDRDGYAQDDHAQGHYAGGYDAAPVQDYDAARPAAYAAAAPRGGYRADAAEEGGAAPRKAASKTTYGASAGGYGQPYGQESYPGAGYPATGYADDAAAGGPTDPRAAQQAYSDEEAAYGYYDEDGRRPAEEDDYAEPPRAHYGRKVFLLTGVCAVVLVSIAGAFGYRAIFSDSHISSPPPVIEANSAPTKVAATQAQDAPGKLIYDRVGGNGAPAGERLLPREEQPVVIKDTSASAPQPFDTPKEAAERGTLVQTIGPTQTLGPASAEPKRVRTVTIRPDQPFTPPDPVAHAPQAPVRAVPNAPAASPFPAPPAAPQRGNAPLSLSPQGAAAPPAAAARAPAPPPSRLASTGDAVAAPVATGSYAVQLSSHRTEGEAQASFRTLQSRYSSLLSGRQPIIRRADLGGKGIYYRLFVGPFAASEEATGLCGQLKSAGGNCIVQRN